MIVELENLLKRHGEVVVQAIIENIERYEGIRCDFVMPLEERWGRIMQGNQPVMAN